jgi:phosphopantothenoylcysteine decarboxylase/phosphopantothenate--cysteine ligase
MGNFRAESSQFESAIYQNEYKSQLGLTNQKYVDKVNDGTYNNFTHDRVGFGIAQWTLPIRKTNLLNKFKGKIGDLNCQLDFVKYELESNTEYQKVYKLLKTSNDICACTEKVLLTYENPANKTDAAKIQRCYYAQEIYDKYAKGKKVDDVATNVVTNAATESIKLARELRRNDVEVKCFMSEAACEIIHPNSMEFATGNSVVTKLTGDIEHVKYSQEDLILVAPATANTISKFANRIADNPISTLLITAYGHDTPIIFVPSMHDSMYRAIEENIEKIEQEGSAIFINPRMDEGKAKFPSKEDIVLESLRAINLNKKD